MPFLRPTALLPLTIAAASAVAAPIAAPVSASVPVSAPASAPVSAPSLPLYVNGLQPNARVLFGDFDVQRPLVGAAGRMDDDPKLPHAVVEARRTSRDGKDGALGLTWKDAWFATVRVETAPLDLRPYLAKGTMSFDLKVNELAAGGLAVRLDCGKDCERKVGNVIPARTAQGQGWRHLSYALSCFHRAGDDFSAVTQPFALDGTGNGDVEIADIRIDADGTPNTPCPDYRTVSVTPEPLNESWSLDWWMPRHEEKLAEIARRRAAGTRTDLVFVGDSITHNWEKENKGLWDAFWGRYGALNLGYGGDRTENVLWRLQHGEIDGIDPKVVVLMIGTNNNGMRHDAPDTIVAEIRTRQPRAKVLLLAVFPRGATPDDPLRVVNDRVNALLPALADGRNVIFLDLNHAFLAPDGTLSKAVMPDLLHPNADGYRIWQRALQPTVDRLLR